MHKFVASFFGTGLILGHIRGADAGSGTVGSIFAFPAALWIGTFGIAAQAAATILVITLALWSIGPLVDSEGDAGWIVIDEAAGMFLATVGLALAPALAAFVVFRLADIFKNAFPGVARAEAIRGPSGIVADDLVAGIYGLGAGLLVTFI